MKRLDVAIAVVFRQSRILICRRQPGGEFGGLWEFPGGKVEAGESLEECLNRELAEELAMTVRISAALPVIQHDYQQLHVTLHPFLCEYICGDAQPIGCQEIRWIDPQHLRDFTFPAANASLIEQLILGPPIS